MTPLQRSMHPVHRGFALALGTIGLTNLAASYRANQWWIDLRIFSMAGPVIVGITAVMLIAWACRPTMSRYRRRVTLAAALLLTTIAGANAAVVWSLQLTGRIESTAIPFSAVLAVLLFSTFRVMRLSTPRPRRSFTQSIPIGGMAGAFVILFALGQMYTLGQTDYRRSADAAVVFGARAYADGRLSLALADRVRTGVALYQAGRVERLIMSGGPGDGDIHEAEAMRDYAISLGVPPEDITLDRMGLNTRATVTNTASTGQRLIAVSHFYHLPRIKMTYQQAGRDVLTMPAAESRTLTALPYYLAREVAAWWVYHAQSFVG